MFEKLRKSIQENRRLWVVIAVASLTSVLIAWGAFTGFSFGFSRFFAAEAPTDSSQCPITPQGNTVAAPVISVQCGTGQNILTWTDTESIEGVRVQLQRNSYDASGATVAGTNLTDEVGCTGTFRVNSFVDTTAPAGLVNNYVIKVGGRQNMWSNVATCGTAAAPARDTVATTGSQCHWQSPDDRSSSLCTCSAANRANLCHVCTRSWREGNTDYSDGQWAAWDATGLCRPACPDPGLPYETERTRRNGDRFPLPQGCVEKPADCPDGYYALTLPDRRTICEASTPVPTPTPTPTPVQPAVTGTCAPLYPPVAKCYGAHACVGRSDAVCGSTFVTNDSPGEIGYGVYYGFEDVYKAPDGTVYWFNWRTKSPPQNDPTTWTWAKIPSNPQAWCASPAQGIVSVQAPTTDLHAIFDAQAQAGRFGCAVAKVGAYNNKGDSVGIDCPAAEKAYYACRASLNDRAPTPTPTPTPALTPTPTTPSPQPGTLRCLPATQTIQFGQFSDHSAQGGDGQSYRWSATPGAVQESGSTYFATYSWQNVGTKRVSVTSGSQTADCVVIVKSGTATLVTKQVRNKTGRQVAFRNTADVRGSDVIELAISVGVSLNGTAGPFRIADSFPKGLSYVAGSARANGSPIADPVISDAGLLFPDITVPGGTAVVVEYAAVGDRLGFIPEGLQTATYTVAVTDLSSGTTDTGAAVTLTLFGTGLAVQTPPVGPAQIPTGPGDTVTFALIAAIVSSLLYAAYTRSAAFRGREVARLERDQGPMDFRS